MKPPKNAPIYGGVPINPRILKDLNAAMAELDSGTYAIAKANVTQGWNSGTVASADTHDNGYCIDWATKDMSGVQISRLCSALQKHGFAPAFRYIGKVLGPNNIVRREHIHAAWRGQANYYLILPTIQPGGSNYLPSIIGKHRGNK